MLDRFLPRRLVGTKENGTLFRISGSFYATRRHSRAPIVFALIQTIRSLRRFRIARPTRMNGGPLQVIRQFCKVRGEKIEKPCGLNLHQ
jgi:hypothetical protein